MNANVLPPFVGIALTKSEFCYCTGLTPYQLGLLLHKHYDHLRKLGYTKYAKYLMPSQVLYLLEVTGLQVDIDLYYQFRQSRKMVK